MDKYCCGFVKIGLWIIVMLMPWIIVLSVSTTHDLFNKFIIIISVFDCMILLPIFLEFQKMLDDGETMV